MPNQSGPDLVPDLPQNIQPPTRETVPQYFKDDVATYLTIGRSLLEADLEREPLPFNDTLRDYLPRNPFNNHYVLYRVLQDVGYDIRLFDRASSENRVAVQEAIAVHVSPEDSDIVDSIKGRTVYGSHLPYNFLLYGKGASLDYLHLDRETGYYRSTRREMLLAHTYDQTDHLLARSFLTSQVVRHVQAPLSNGTAPPPYPPNLELYETLRSKGTAPFTAKELYDMTGKLTSLVIANYRIPLP